MPSVKESKNTLRSLEAKGFYSDCGDPECLSAVLIRSPAPTGKIKSIYINDLPQGYYLYTADDIPGSKTMEVNGTSVKIFGYGNVSYTGEPLGILVGPDENVVQDLRKNVIVNFNIESLESALKNVIKGQKRTEISKKHEDLTNFVSELNDMPSLNTVIDKTHAEDNTQEILATRIIKTGLWKRNFAQAEKKLFSNADFVSDQKWKLALKSPSWQETNGAYCYTEGKNIHVFAPTRWTWAMMKSLSQVLKLPEKYIHVHKTKPSGIFPKGLWRTTQIAAQVCLASFLSKKAVKLILSQKEQDTYMLPGVQTDFTYKTAVSKEGKIKALKILIDIDAGCYNPFAQEITDRLAISSCSYYKPENVYIEAKCHTSKKPPTSINIKNLDSHSFFAIENQIQELSKITHQFPGEIREINTNVEKTDFPFHIKIEDYKECFENSIRISDFNRKYASFNMDAINRASHDSSPFFGLPLRGIGVSTAYNISAYYGDSSFSYNPKIEVTLLPDNKVEIHAIKPSLVIQDIWKQTVSEILQIKKENVTINSDFAIDEIPNMPEDASSSITTVNEIIKKCCLEIQKKRFHQPLPIVSQKTLGTSVTKGWNKEKFSGNPFGTTSFATTVVEVELDSYTYSEKIKGIWITINCGQLYDKAAALRALRLEIQQELTMLVSGKTIPCDNYTIEFIESDNKSGQISELIRNTLPAAFSSALSLALATQLNEIPCTENQLYTLMKERETNKIETEKEDKEKGAQEKDK
ncbi:MAG: molybdopterin-dependent oxidoreductase [Treponema sp.]|nr:molybdopterin-dependent oxidoreductase [Treponema sp.]